MVYDRISAEALDEDYFLNIKRIFNSFEGLRVVKFCVVPFRGYKHQVQPDFASPLLSPRYSRMEFFLLDNTLPAPKAKFLTENSGVPSLFLIICLNFKVLIEGTRKTGTNSGARTGLDFVLIKI